MWVVNLCVCVCVIRPVVCSTVGDWWRTETLSKCRVVIRPHLLFSLFVLEPIKDTLRTKSETTLKIHLQEDVRSPQRHESCVTLVSHLHTRWPQTHHTHQVTGSHRQQERMSTLETDHLLPPSVKNVPEEDVPGQTLLVFVM